jgi:hypothetical protein
VSTQVIHETLAENTAKHEGEKNPAVRVRADEKVSESSKLESYRFCEETWTMELTDAEVQLPGNVPPIKLPRAMIVAVPSAQNFVPRHHAAPHELSCSVSCASKPCASETSSVADAAFAVDGAGRSDS